MLLSLKDFLLSTLYISGQPVMQYVLRNHMVSTISPMLTVSSGCGCRALTPVVEGSCEYIELLVAHSQQGVVLHVGAFAGSKKASS